MPTVAEPTTTHKPPVAYYGWLREAHGVFLAVDGTVHFLDDGTKTWEAVDLPTLTTWAVLNGRVDLVAMADLFDGDRVYKCSKTMQEVG